MRTCICRCLYYYLSCCNFSCCRWSRFFRPNQDGNHPFIFGDLNQCSRIMEKTFEGKQFMIPSIKGRNQPKIDCMFFPATHGDIIELDPKADLNNKEYLNKSTIIMCNPNALIYQWMVTPSNAYWLDFFLRRDCNVLIWNCRGYGQSQQSKLTPNQDPNQQKIDAERVLQFLVNRIQVKGQIGVYGRSIGGIAASHLTGQFPELISVFIGDRTMGDFEQLVVNRYASGKQFMLKFYYFLGCKWSANNVSSLMKNKSCYKIITFDQNDDVVDIYSSIHHGLSAKCCTIEYNNDDWRQFYHTLFQVYLLEDQLLEVLGHNDDAKERIRNHMLKKIDDAQQMMMKQDKWALKDDCMKQSTNFQITGKQAIRVPLGIKSFNLEECVSFLQETMQKQPKMQDPVILDRRNQALSDLFVLFHQLVISTYDLSAGCLSIDRVIGLQFSHDFHKFVSFLQVLEVYGTGYGDDIHYKLYRVRDKETHVTSTIVALEKVVRMVMICKFQISNRMLLESVGQSEGDLSSINFKVLKERLMGLLDYL